MARPQGVPAWDWLLHEVWWRLTWQSPRRRGHKRANLRNHYTNWHLRHAVESAGIPEERRPEAWVHLARTLERDLPQPRR